MLLYANRAAGPGLQFRVHGQLTVSDVQVRPHAFIIVSYFCWLRKQPNKS